MALKSLNSDERKDRIRKSKEVRQFADRLSECDTVDALRELSYDPDLATEDKWRIICLAYKLSGREGKVGLSEWHLFRNPTNSVILQATKEIRAALYHRSKIIHSLHKIESFEQLEGSDLFSEDEKTRVLLNLNDLKNKDFIRSFNVLEIADRILSEIVEDESV